MSATLPVTTVAVMIPVSDFAAALDWYTRLLGRPPDRAFFPNFQEWRLTDTCWLQIAEGVPVAGGTAISFGVADIEAVRQRLHDTLQWEIGEVERVPGVAAWCRFSDPFGNRLGLYQHTQPEQTGS